jgi:hypothetical protein
LLFNSSVALSLWSLIREAPQLRRLRRVRPA